MNAHAASVPWSSDHWPISSLLSLKLIIHQKTRRRQKGGRRWFGRITSEAEAELKHAFTAKLKLE
jgi:hypothetical protein